MKPFTAWLAMHRNSPMKFGVGDGGWFASAEPQSSYRIEAYSNRQDARSNTPSEGMTAPKRVLIIADTEENRKKLGMGEFS